MQRVYFAGEAARRGVELHTLACDLIRLGVKLPDEPKTMNMYVNDAIGFRMVPEQTLYYSENCFGTADAIGWRNNKLRIADLKTGLNAASFEQLLIYAALFCLEYRYKPFEIEIEMRIYQNNEAQILEADPVNVTYAMDKIVTLDKLIKTWKGETP